jgi:xanthine/CO dehydrogenase XdhC/CoxF family maturation factor
MTDMLQIADAWMAKKESGTRSALLTVISSRGSTYRKPGAHMLVGEDGSSCGMISGGCLDRDLFEHTLVALREGTPRIVAYDTSRADALIWGVGGGCRGMMEILLEPLDDADVRIFAPYREVAAHRRPAVVATIARVEGASGSRVGDRVVFGPSGHVGRLVDAAGESRLLEEAETAFGNRASSSLHFETGDGTIDALIEYVPPPIALVLLGAGNDAEPIAALAAPLGWEVTVVDQRRESAIPDRFPRARVLVLGPEELARELCFDDRTAVVLMTHNYHHDLELLRLLLNERLTYLGILGPKSRTEQLVREVQIDENAFDPAVLEAIYGPVGLDIGSRSPEEIALAIVAEVQMAMSGGDGRPLRARGDAKQRPAGAALTGA